MQPLPQLTDQQQAIVQHREGPALVFAVAGAGKTTAMVHRIERLVREHVFEAGKILATSFNKAAVNDIRIALDRWPHCARVQAKTLHGIGYGIISRAERNGYLSRIDLNTGNKDGLDRQILYRALAQARRGTADYIDELEAIDQEDFLSYVGNCKGNLLYADLPRAELPAAGLKVARQAEAPPGLEWYLDLYRLYESIRQDDGFITYDDMLMSGWELLIRHPDLLREMRGKYGCVLVDEFQDVNRAQDAILDLLTFPHRNYMAIGDDDQTIYEWRGASPEFILDFCRRYRATKFLINDNFRCPAAQVVLANRVIEHNRRREPKRLSLTRGFTGSTFVHHMADGEQQARMIVDEIQAALARGYKRTDIVVLVRVYAQTPYIEQGLIEARIPYHVAGSVPFYQRPEIVTLLNYCRLAAFEGAIQAGHILSSDEVADLARAWNNVYNRPKRYISKQIAEHVRSQVVFHNVPLSRALAVASADAANNSIGERMRALAHELRWLAEALDTKPAVTTLCELDDALKYQEYLRRSSGFPETGEGRAASVTAFIDYARNKGTLRQFLEHLEHISFGSAGRESEHTKDSVEITTIFRAKGREWPMVFVPDCNDGLIPFGRPERIEEERRLFYVAITRSKEWLHLGVTGTKPRSQFLDQASYRETLEAVNALGTALTHDATTRTVQDAIGLATHPQQLHFERYFEQWWNVPPETKLGIASFVQRFYTALERHDARTLLGIPADSANIWRTFGPPGSDDEGDIPGFVELLEKLRAMEALRTAETELIVQARRAAETRRAVTQSPARPHVALRSSTNTRFRPGDVVELAPFGTGTVQQVEFVHHSEEALIEFDGGRKVRYVVKYGGLKLIARNGSGQALQRPQVQPLDDELPF